MVIYHQSWWVYYLILSLLIVEYCQVIIVDQSRTPWNTQHVKPINDQPVDPSQPWSRPDRRLSATESGATLDTCDQAMKESRQPKMQLVLPG